jgi:hypothetical protein
LTPKEVHKGRSDSYKLQAMQAYLEQLKGYNEIEVDWCSRLFALEDPRKSGGTFGNDTASSG